MVDNFVPAALVEAFRGRYELVRETGRGGSAMVYLARDTKHDRFVALKVLNPDVGHTTGERFLREIQVSAGMQHPHILPTYDSGIADGRLYFVMPFVDGGSLRQRLDAATALPVDEALRVAHEVAVALAHAHDLGVVHRDVKPENILFYHGHACLADFGVARAIEQIDASITGHGTVVGTPAYMSPEQVMSAGFDGRSDVYSLACVLYEMIAGTRLFDGSTAKEVLLQRAHRPSIRKLRPKVPAAVDALLTRALATSPADRYADARQFAAALEHAARMMQTVERVSGPRRAFGMLPEPRWAWATALIVAVLAVTVASSPLRHVMARIPSSIGSEVAPAAYRAFEAGNAALAVWDVATAQARFAEAAAADRSGPFVQLRLAQSLALGRGVAQDDFRVTVMRLAGMRARLHGRDSLLAEGLIALGEGAFPRACEAYDRLIQRDSLDVLAWYGLGDCHSLDSAVVRHNRSPSGWTFRSSWHAASRAYIRAVTIQPASHAALPYSALTTLLPTDAIRIRTGMSEAEPRVSFAAYPTLSEDTVAYYAYPAATFAAVIPTTPEMLKRNGDVLLAFAGQWTAAAPGSADAFEALSLAREARGELGRDADGAGGAIAIARSLSVTPLQQTRLAAADVRVHVKLGEFARARAIADSALAAWTGKTPDWQIAERLSGLAALTGRIGLNAELRTIATSARYADAGIAPQLTAAASRFFARAAPGVCDDSLVVLRREFDRLLDSYAPPARREQVRGRSLGRASALAYPCMRSAAHSGIAAMLPLDRAQRAYTAHNRGQARAMLDSLRRVRTVMRPGDVALDHTVQEAWLRAAIGDTAASIRQLDLVLEALPTLSTLSVREDAQSAAVGRALALRAELAAARRDTAAARRWAGYALELWANADAPLRPTLDRLRLLSSGSR